jgi:DNA-binding MarR family transcriptional regulator
METVSSERRHRFVLAKRALRDVNNQISLLSHRVSTGAQIKDIDLDTLDYLSQHGPKSATALAKGIGLHPATMTGVLDRLENGGWIQRDRDPADRRGILIRIDPSRNSEILALYSGMDSAMNEVVSAFSDDQLDTIIDFLERTARAGASTTEQLDGIVGGATGDAARASDS